ncbi:hypothetical protein HPP92_022492 [Vanilla planifolia]|uniref:Uncharacterized protein n=1 Tax=Vanilla planifolia TaxID=51239 RepID=A0A835PRL9_VANPL|nr:hypothetical protein HPP92_022492 [Vanilla planifolia]
MQQHIAPAVRRVPFPSCVTQKSACCLSLAAIAAPHRFHLALIRTNYTISGRHSSLRCRSGVNRGPPTGDNESKDILDAFFLGRAFAETLNERIGSAVGEILSVVGQWQAEQQKQVQDFQEEILERAKRAKERAALETMESQGIISPSLPASAETDKPISPPYNGPTMDDAIQEKRMHVKCWSRFKIMPQTSSGFAELANTRSIPSSTAIPNCI